MKKSLSISLCLSFIWLLFNANEATAQNKTNPENTLTEGVNITRTLSASERHIYKVELKNGEALEAEIIQESIDVVIDILDENGGRLSQIDGWGKIEKIDFTSPKDGMYTLMVFPYEEDAKAGSYKLSVKNLLSLSANAKRVAKLEIPSDTLFTLWEKALTNDNAIDDFVNGHTEQHIIEPIQGDSTDMLVTYFCLLDEDTEYAMQSGGPDFLGFRFQQLGTTKLYFASHRVPKDARFNYGFNYFKLYTAGPNNDVQYRKIEHVYDGTVVMPYAPKQPYITEYEHVKKGELKQTILESSFLNEERKLTVYTPAGYDEKSPHNLLIIFDGEAYGAKQGENAPVPTPTILDNLHAEEKIEPTVAILVWEMGNRNKDLISTDFSDFIAEEVIKWARENYNIYPESDHVILAGSSRGGFAASFIALNHSNLIGKVLSQSGSYWIKGTSDENHWMYPTGEGKLIKAYKESPLLPVRFYMNVGLYDTGAGMLGMNREFRTILELKGYNVDYNEFKGGHSYVNWRGTLSNGLISLIGKQ